MKAFDSIECGCGARTTVGNIGKKDTPVLFIGGAYKHGLVKVSTNPFWNEAKERCLWCGKEWPENLKEALKAGFLK